MTRTMGRTVAVTHAGRQSEKEAGRRPVGDPICTDGIERLRVRVHPPQSRPATTLIYLPGVQGDWTLITPLRLALERRFEWVEMTYPRHPHWQLSEYAEAIEAELLGLGIQGGWLLGESFGSQVMWELVRRGRLRYDGLILAGGFVKYPSPRLLDLAQWIAPRLPATFLRAMLRGYVLYGSLRFRGAPEAMRGVHDFVARRTPADMAALEHRFRLIAGADPRDVASQTSIPVHHLYGALDPIVPWPPVARWLSANCPALRGSRRIAACDHTVLATAAQASAGQICQWLA